MTSSSERKDSLINKSFHWIFFPYVHVHGFHLLACLYIYFFVGQDGEETEDNVLEL